MNESVTLGPRCVLVHAVCTPSPTLWCETTGELVLDPDATAFVTGDFDGDGRIDVVTPATRTS